MPRPLSRRLVVLRHAKAAWPDDLDDLDRPLTARGRRDAAAAAGWLAERGLAPDLVVLSPSRRTRETAELAAADTARRVDDRVYDASPQRLLAVVAEVPEHVERLLLVCHEPGASGLAAALAAVDDDLRPLAMAGLPTCGAAVLAVPGAWSALEGGGARLEAVEAVRG